MDENEVFNKEYNNLQFAKHVIDNYSNQFLSMFCSDQSDRYPKTPLKYLYKLIDLYPLILKDYYYLLFQLLEKCRGSDRSLKYTIKFLKHIQIIYPTTFNINYLWNPSEYDQYELTLKEQTLLYLLVRYVIKPIDRQKYILSIPGVDSIQVFNCVLDISTLGYNSVYKWLNVLFTNDEFNNCDSSLICEAIVNWMHMEKVEEDEFYIKNVRKYVKQIIAYLRGKMNDNKIKNNKIKNKTMEDTLSALHSWME
eukprot:444148_1